MGLLDKAAEALKKAVQSAISMPDPAAFDDPVALKTEWKPLKPGGASFRTHKLADDGAGGIRFVPTVGFRLFALVFLGVGLAWMVPCLLALKPVGLCGLVFAGPGAYMLWPKKKRFDPGTRSCTLGDTETPFGSIHAVQLIREWVSSDDGGYYSYELNLVLKDGSRLNVVDHANLEALRDDADRVATCIGCKVWDGMAAPQLSLEQLAAKLNPP